MKIEKPYCTPCTDFSPKKVCSESLLMTNPRWDVESLWNQIVFCSLEAISTILPKKWAHISSGMNL